MAAACEFARPSGGSMTITPSTAGTRIPVLQSPRLENWARAFLCSKIGIQYLYMHKLIGIVVGLIITGFVVGDRTASWWNGHPLRFALEIIAISTVSFV